MTAEKRIATIERFAKHVENGEGCKVWTGSKNNKGYGLFRFLGKTTSAHRVAYTLYVGSIPRKKHVLHTCDNPACVNINHLWLGTNADNMADKVNKGRQLKGESHPSSIFTNKKVVELRRLYETGNYTMNELAKRFKVKQTIVCNIINRKRWTEV